MRAFLQSRSLRFWITVSMAVAVLPLAAAAILGYALLNHGVIDSFNDIVSRQDAHVVAIQDLRLLVADTVVSVDEFVEDRNPEHQAAYRRYRGEVEGAFAALVRDLGDLPAAQDLVRRAQDAWTIADRHATELLATGATPGDAAVGQALALFHGEIAGVSDRLRAAYGMVSEVIAGDLDTAARFYECALWISGIAAVVSVLAIALGVFMIGRIVGASVTRIVTGAALFADGDRVHRIEVQVPAELRDVADEFNRMAERIRESESALADLAQRDALTSLPNRRALDDALAAIEGGGAWREEKASVLAVDIDHFKAVNDTYGHAAGDAVLRAIGKTLAAQSRPADKVFRTGGEEFAVLLPDTDGRTAQMIAERLRQAIEGLSTVHGGTTIAVTVSIGVAAAHDHGKLRDMMEAADAALYVAKESGRNGVVLGGAGGHNAAFASSGAG